MCLSLGPFLRTPPCWLACRLWHRKSKANGCDQCRQEFSQPYNVDSIAEVLATAAVKSWDYYEDTCAKIMATRDWFSQELQAIGFDVLTFKTNFVLVKPHGVTAGQLFDYLQSKKIYVRYFPKVERISDRLRISIGTQDEMERVLMTIQELQA